MELIETLPSHVTDAATLSLLKRKSFTHEHSDEMYSDYLRTPSGFGEDGTDRLERVTFMTENRMWFPFSEHIDLDGNEWYRQVGPPSDLAAAIKWLKKDQKKAPKRLF